MPVKKYQIDKFLLMELRNGNEKAFRKLFDMFWEPMFVNAKSIVFNADDAKDIVQNVWIDLWLRRETTEIRNFEGYVFKAVNNSCYKYLRDNKFNKTQLLVIESLPSQLTSAPDVEKQYDLEETQIAIEKSLKKLPPRCRQIFKLSRIKEVSNEEIASILGISKRSVENQISYALKFIRENLTITQSVLILSFYLLNFI